MNWLDCVLGLILLSSILAGFARGFSRTVIGMVSVLLAVFLATWCYGVAGSFLQDYVSHKSVANFIGFLLVFLGVLAIGSGVGHLLAKALKWTGLGWLDRLMGGGLGVVRGLLLGMALVMVLCAFTRQQPPKSVAESALAPYVIDASSLMATVAPRELKQGFNESYAQVKKLWKDLLKKGPDPKKPQELKVEKL